MEWRLMEYEELGRGLHAKETGSGFIIWTLVGEGPPFSLAGEEN